MPPLTLVEALAGVPDPRSCHGRIHPWPVALGLLGAHQPGGDRPARPALRRPAGSRLGIPARQDADQGHAVRTLARPGRRRLRGRAKAAEGQTTVELVYGITSLPPEAADAARLLERVRDHRRIEICLHHVRGVTPGEGACRVRCGSAPRAPAALRDAAVHQLAGVAAEGRAAATERLQARPTEALQLIGVPPSQ